MQYRKLGRTGIEVSSICLGTMTWGSQNNQAEADAQLDLAIGEGVNFIDTAEMYPTTPRTSETFGETETILGNWLKGRADRDKLIVATKVTGEGNSNVRGGARVTGKIVREALEASLVRLQTDYTDLYQLHWPNRGSYSFRRNWKYDPSSRHVGNMEQEVADILGEVALLKEEGKLREFGLSNETAWGVMKFVEASERHGLPRIVSIQNEYSLLCRLFDLDLAETCIREDVGLMAYSPLATGLLTGKYAGGEVPAGSRLTILANLNGRATEQAHEATAAYCDLARQNGLPPEQMALAFAMSRPFMMSVIIGATSIDQLKTNLGAARVALSEDVMEAIGAIHRRYPMPM